MNTENGNGNGALSTSDTAMMDRRILLEQAIIIRALLGDDATTAGAGEDGGGGDLEVIQKFVKKETMELNNHQLAAISTDLLLAAALCFV